MIYRGVFSIHYSPGSEAAMGWAEVGGHNMINMTIRDLHWTFADFFTKLEFSRGLYIILITPKGTAKLRWAGWGAEDTIFFRVPRSSLRVRRSSVGCSIVQKGTA